MRSLLLALLLLASGTACAYPAPDYAAAKAATLRIEMPGGVCSGTAVGPHLVLTAEHCASGGTEGWKVGGRTARILKVVSDGNDHVLLTTDLYFKHTAKFGARPKQGDILFVHGNPGGFADMLIIGHVAGWADTRYGAALIADMNCWFGCSGAAMFDRHGRIVGVVNASYSSDPQNRWRLTAAFPLGFGPADVKG